MRRKRVGASMAVALYVVAWALVAPVLVYASSYWSTGAGKYYFFFDKADDGATVYSNNVHMYN